MKQIEHYTFEPGNTSALRSRLHTRRRLITPVFNIKKMTKLQLFVHAVFVITLWGFQIAFKDLRPLFIWLIIANTVVLMIRLFYYLKATPD